MLALARLFLFTFLISTSAEAAPARLVTLSPMLAEWTAEILGTRVATKILIGVSEYSDYPAELKKIETVGPYPQIQVEKIAALKPELVIGSIEANRPDQLEKLRRLKLKLEVMPGEKFASMEMWIRKLGDILGEPKGAAEAAKKWVEGVGRLKSPIVNPKVKPKRVLIQIQDHPIIVVGGDSFLNEAFAQVGYENVFSGLKQSYPKVSREAVLKENPDVIFVLDQMGHPEDFKKTAESWKKFESMTAVKNHDVRAISADDYARCSLRLLNALKQLH